MILNNSEIKSFLFAYAIHLKKLLIRGSLSEISKQFNTLFPSTRGSNPFWEYVNYPKEEVTEKFIQRIEGQDTVTSFELLGWIASDSVCYKTFYSFFPDILELSNWNLTQRLIDKLIETTDFSGCRWFTIKYVGAHIQISEVSRPRPDQSVDEEVLMPPEIPGLPLPDIQNPGEIVLVIVSPDDEVFFHQRIQE